MISTVVAFILGVAVRDVYIVVAGVLARRRYQRAFAAAMKRMQGCSHSRTTTYDPMQWGVSSVERCNDCGGFRVDESEWRPGTVPRPMPR